MREQSAHNLIFARMNPLKVNLLNDDGGRTLARTGSQRRGRIFYFLAFALVFAFFFGLGRISLSETAVAAMSRLDEIPFFRQMHLIASPDRQLIGEADDRINILLLGIGGQGHDGPNLTDTMLVMSIRPSDSKVAMRSIPRDLLVPLGDYGWRKINAANAFGEMKQAGQGPEMSRTAVEGMLGLEVPYYVRIDFNGFKQIIDDLGGIDVYVDQKFTDYSYPDSRHGYQTISFKQGWQRMDGETALEYSRSRHGNNGEGSDFARAKRQQKVLLALKEQLLTLRTLKDPTKITAILGGLQQNIRTNQQLGEILRLAKIGRGVDPGQIVHRVIDDSPGSPVVAETINGAYVLVPRNDDWEALRQVADGLFGEKSDIALSDPSPTAEAPTDSKAEKAGGKPSKSNSDQLTPAKQTKPVRQGNPGDSPAPNDIRVEILNGSGRVGLARLTADRLKGFGYQIGSVGNASSQGRARTAIYDLTGGDLGVSISDLKRALGVTDPEISASPSPLGDQRAADLLVILGQDVPNS